MKSRYGQKWSEFLFVFLKQTNMSEKHIALVCTVTHVYNRVTKWWRHKKFICEIASLIVIFRKNKIKNASMPKFSILPPISDEILSRFCSDDPILFKIVVLNCLIVYLFIYATAKTLIIFVEKPVLTLETALVLISNYSIFFIIFFLFIILIHLISENKSYRWYVSVLASDNLLYFYFLLHCRIGDFVNS